MYVSSYVPYNVCFSSNESIADNQLIVLIDRVVDILFFIDIIVNFISSYEDPQTKLPVVKLKHIAKHYIGTWFIIDLITVLPIDLIQDLVTNNENDNLQESNVHIKLARLARLPRIYKILRILRLSKILSVASKGIIQNMIETLNFSFGMIRIIKIISITFFLAHLASCFWYLAATFEDSLFNTWVGARGIVDSDSAYKYFNAFYWAF